MSKAQGIAQSANQGQFKNRIINGAMMIDQRNEGNSVTPSTGTYTLDRWRAYQNVAGKFTVQQNAGSVTPPAGFTNYLGITSTSAYSASGSDLFLIIQNIEGYNVADLNFGTANASTVTLSFWVRSSLTGTFGGALVNGSENRSYPFIYTISAANTWEQKSITVAGDTTGTWNKTNSLGLEVNFGLGSGSTLSGTAGAWVDGGKFTVTGATSVVGTNGATFYITGVQLEKGSTATSFDYRTYGTELALCQRYFQKSWNQGVAIGTATHDGGIHVLSWGDGNASGLVWQTAMRAAPTVTFYPTNSTTAGSVNSGGTDRTASAFYPSQRGYSYIAVTSGAVNTYTRFQYIANAEF